jgi:thioredoxin reductase (NADPH)
MIEQAGTTLPLVTMFGPPGSALSYAIRDFLYRSDVPFAWVQLLSDAQARSEAGVEHLANTRLPICVLADGARLECPTVRQII